MRSTCRVISEAVHSKPWAAATVDQPSSGRLTLGLRAGWNEQEHRMFGVPFPTLKARLDRLEEGIKQIRDSWILSGTKPVQDPLPILLGGEGERALEIVAREAAPNGTSWGSTWRGLSASRTF